MLVKHRTTFSCMVNRMPTEQQVASALADAFLCGPWTRDSLVRLARSVFVDYRKRKWIETLVDRLLEARPKPPPPSRKGLISFILRGDNLAACHKLPEADVLRLPQRKMMPDPALDGLSLPALTTLAELAGWLQLVQQPTDNSDQTEQERFNDQLPEAIRRMEWFCGRFRFASSRDREHQSRLDHYHYRWTRPGKRRSRLIEIPKPQIKQLQRRVLRGILDLIPTHAAAHGFRKGRSVSTWLAPHINRDVVLRIDLREFFPSIAARRITAIFRRVGYPEQIAQFLCGLCTNSVPASVLDAETAAVVSNRDRYRIAHLPQGSPTSPALANLAAFNLDRRMSGLAKCFGAAYSRYADDMVFSGDKAFRRRLERFRVLACAIAIDEGFEIRHRKTQVLPAGQRQLLGGVVVNSRINVPRTDYDNLRATLHNCIRHGPASQNRDDLPAFRQHLEGRVAYINMLNSDRGAKLRAMLVQIDWAR